MRKHRILAGILAVALVLSLGGVNISAATGSPMADAAEVSVPEGYCEQDYLKLCAFLKWPMPTASKWHEAQRGLRPHGSRLGVPPTKKAKSTITWLEATTGEGEDEVTLQYLLTFNAPASDLCGQLDLSGCKFLREVCAE